jgi:hypothetical protein
VPNQSNVPQSEDSLLPTKLVVDLDEFQRSVTLFEQIEKVKLGEIRWVRNGETVHAAPRDIVDWNYTGLNNRDFAKEFLVLNRRVRVARCQGIVDINTACWRGHRAGKEVSIPDYENDLEAAMRLVKEAIFDRYDANLYTSFQKNMLGVNNESASATQLVDAYLATMEAL